MDERILDFIKNNTVFTLSTAIENRAYAANCFYVFDKVNKVLIFMSDTATQHMQDALKNKQVSGTIWDGNIDIASLKGIQFKGELINPDPQTATRFKDIYLEQYPIAKEMDSSIWGIQLSWIKMTNNTLGFGKKLEWEI